MNAAAERMKHDSISRMRSAEPEGFTAQMNIIRTANFGMSGTVNWDILNELVRETDQWYEDRAKSEELDAFLGEFQIMEQEGGKDE